MKHGIKIFSIVLLVILISTTELKAQKAGPAVTNKQARVELKAERKRENIRRRRAAENKELNNPKIARGEKLPKRKQKKASKSEPEQKTSSLKSEGNEIKNSPYVTEPTR